MLAASAHAKIPTALGAILFLLAQCSPPSCGAATAGRDASVLVQGSVRAHRAVEENADASDAAMALLLKGMREAKEDAEANIREEDAEADEGAEGEEEQEEIGGADEPLPVAPDAGPVSTAVTDGPAGPMAFTKLGPLRGVRLDDYTVFRGIPYKEKTRRFEVGSPKRPWAPSTFDATKYKPGCIGSHTGNDEDENCLNLNIWMPNKRQTSMPVIIYIHGGINQHGSGHENLRQGDLIVQSEAHPVIFVNFDFRLGIFGWISVPDSGVPHNIGMQDQQELMRWVQQHISAFGGDPTRVTLQGQSEGCGAILSHLVAPGSVGLFSRVVMNSPVADVWRPNTNRMHTDFIIERSRCKHPKLSSTVSCLKRKDAGRLWRYDWVAEELTSSVVTPGFWNTAIGAGIFALNNGFGNFAAGLGWHAEVDNITLLGNPRELIHKGQWNKVPILLTVARNETRGVITPLLMKVVGERGLKAALKSGDKDRVTRLYNESLVASGIYVHDLHDLYHQMLTDKIFTCDVRTFAKNIEQGGGQAFVGMYWHGNKHDPVGRGSSHLCEEGAACHAGDMMYLLPQGRTFGVHGPGMEAELEFVKRYSESFLDFVHGRSHPWKRYDVQTQPMTLYDTNGTRVVPGYRREQCDVLDSSMSEALPEHMRQGF